MEHPRYPGTDRPVMLGDEVEWDGYDGVERGTVSTIRYNSHLDMVWIHLHVEDSQFFETNECFDVTGKHGYSQIRPASPR